MTTKFELVNSKPLTIERDEVQALVLCHLEGCNSELLACQSTRVTVSSSLTVFRKGSGAFERSAGGDEPAQHEAPRAGLQPPRKGRHIEIEERSGR